MEGMEAGGQVWEEESSYRELPQNEYFPCRFQRPPCVPGTPFLLPVTISLLRMDRDRLPAQDCATFDYYAHSDTCLAPLLPTGLLSVL